MKEIIEMNNNKERLDYLIDTLLEDISTNSSHLLEIMRDNENIIASKENLSIVFSEGLITDITFITKNYSSILPNERFIFNILRSTVEHVIKYKYFLKNEEFIEQYFGENIDPDKALKMKNLIKAMKQFGEYRYKTKLPSTQDMANEVNELNSIGKRLSLYDAFKLLSDYTHDGYFKDYFSNLEGVDKSWDIVLLIMITTTESFIESFKKVIPEEKWNKCKY